MNPVSYRSYLQEVQGYLRSHLHKCRIYPFRCKQQQVNSMCSRAFRIPTRCFDMKEADHVQEVRADPLGEAKSAEQIAAQYEDLPLPDD